MDDLLHELEHRKVTITVEDIAARILRTCKVCHQEFNLVEFIAHKKLLHPDPAPISRKEKERIELPTVLNGLSPGNLNCTICGETFEKETLLRIHQVQKHSSSLVACLTKATLPVNCRIVRKLVWGSGSENGRRRPPLNFKRFQCAHCEKRFVLHSQCKSHENAHVETPISVRSEEESVFEVSQNPVDFPLGESESSSNSEKDQLEIVISNGIHPTASPEASVVVLDDTSFGTETPSEITTTSSSCGDMEGQVGNNNGGMPMMEMPKLVAPTQPHRLSDFTNFQGGPNRTLLVTNMSSLPAPMASEPEIRFEAPTPMLNGIIKGEVHVVSSISAPAAVLTNGDTFPRECDEKTHKCLSCDKIFPESQLFPHIKSHLKKGQKECSLCAYKSIASGDLRDHMNKHYNIKPYKCPVADCTNAYVWQSGWKKHLETHSKGEKSFKCNHCKLMFDTQRERRRHELVHKNITGPSPAKKQKKATSPKPSPVVGSKNLPPPQPTQQFYGNSDPAAAQPQSYQQTQYHQYPSQAPPNNYNASAYPSENYTHQDTYYDGSGTLQQQYVTTYNNADANYSQPRQGGNYAPGTYPSNPTPHVQNQPWNNQQSEYQDSKSSNMTGTEGCVEKKEDSGEQFLEPDDLRESETCKTCGVEIRMVDLAVHIQSHILPGQKSCTICKYKCNTKSYLDEHYNIHYGLKPYTCTICKRRFAMRSYLRSHTQQVHEHESTRRFQCRYCNKRFVRACHLRTHEKIHEGHGEVLPIGESSFVNPVMDSDSNSTNSNPSFRPPLTPDRKSSTASTSSSQSNHGGFYPHPSRSNSPQVSVSTGTNLTPVKSEPQWNGPAVSPAGGQTSQPNSTTGSWPYWSGTPYTPQVGAYHDNNSWSSSQGGNPYYYSPLVKSDVNWTEPLAESSSWQQQGQGSQHAQSHGGHGGYTSSPQVKVEGTWAESPSNGFHQTTTNPAPPSTAVQDLWSELHYEEMKWLPETSTVYTADGIPMITELAPFDGFSYTEMLISATADLPLFGTEPDPAPLPFQQNSHEEPEMKPDEYSGSESQVKPRGKKVATGSVQQGPGPGRNIKGRGKGKLTAEAKHKLKLSYAKRVPDNNELELGEDLSPSPNPWEASEDEGESLDFDSMTTCQTCKVDVIRRDLLEHIRAHIVPGQRTCDICQRTYCNTLTLKEHIHVHYKLKPYRCSFCEARFSTKYSLKTHETFSHEEGKASIIECPHPGCGKQYAMHSEFHKHIKAHANKNGTTARQTQPPLPKVAKLKRPTLDSKIKEELMKDAASATKVWEVQLEDIGRKMTKKCPFCNEQILVADFYEHKYNHTEPCHICEKPVPVAEILFHGPTHVSERVCDICGWTAKQRSQIWEHYNSHLKVKPILCLYCGQRFTSRNTLRTHYLVSHTSFRPHSCRYCEKTFVQYNTMRAHEFTHLGNQCPACSETFSKRKDLEIHLREVHKYDY